MDTRRKYHHIRQVENLQINSVSSNVELAFMLVPGMDAENLIIK